MEFQTQSFTPKIISIIDQDPNLIGLFNGQTDSSIIRTLNALMPGIDRMISTSDLNNIVKHIKLKTTDTKGDDLRNYIQEKKCKEAFEILTQIAPDHVIESSRDYMSRGNFTSKYAWAIPSENAILGIKEFIKDKGHILEVGAGLGLWASLLQMVGLQVIPTDGFCSHELEKSTPQTRFTHVEHLDGIKAIQMYKTPCLFMCWPSYGSPFATNCLKEFQGEYLIYIGEGQDGCTADNDFFEILENSWTSVERIDIRRWWGIWDRIEIYQRNPIKTKLNESISKESIIPEDSQQLNERNRRRAARVATSRQITTSKITYISASNASKSSNAIKSSNATNTIQADGAGWKLVKK